MMVQRTTAEAVRAALAAEGRIDLARHPLALSFEGGVLTMEGELPGLRAKKLALERAAAVPGVRHLVDRLRVAPARHMGDAEIRDHVRDTLAGEPALEVCALRIRMGRAVRVVSEPSRAGGAVEVSVSDGVVTLAGEVPSLSHKRLAGVLAWWVPGTRDVVNGLEVRPPEDDSEGEITDAVRLALEKDPLLDADRIQVGARGSVVTLTGRVPSEEQREMAEDDAWFVFGVDEVVNRLAVSA
ncbi:MAG TPA: BON domain-containing protein [Anaeromyxobacteraceae bacterium]|nr:BON domain-containing protein [Anaeromyxobacteraceae bacterium]